MDVAGWVSGAVVEGGGCGGAVGGADVVGVRGGQGGAVAMRARGPPRAVPALRPRGVGREATRATTRVSAPARRNRGTQRLRRGHVEAARDREWLAWISRFRFVTAAVLAQRSDVSTREANPAGRSARARRPGRRIASSSAGLSDLPRARGKHPARPATAGAQARYAARARSGGRIGCRRRDSNPRHADYDSAALTD